MCTPRAAVFEVGASYECEKSPTGASDALFRCNGSAQARDVVMLHWFQIREFSGRPVTCWPGFRALLLTTGTRAILCCHQVEFAAGLEVDLRLQFARCCSITRQLTYLLAHRLPIIECCCNSRSQTPSRIIVDRALTSDGAKPLPDATLHSHNIAKQTQKHHDRASLPHHSHTTTALHLSTTNITILDIPWCVQVSPQA